MRDVYKEVAYLRMKYGHGNPHNSIPDYRTANNDICSNRFAKVAGKKEEMKPPPGVAVSHLHKSSMQVLLPSELKSACRKV
jgi:hypothetical protein